MEIHLIFEGIQPSYTVWSFHKESFPTHHGDNKDSDDEDNNKMIDILTNLVGPREISHTIDKGLDEISMGNHDQSDKFDDLLVRWKISYIQGVRSSLC